MNSVKRSLIKLAIVGTLAGGMVGMPLIASASSGNANPNACHGQIVSYVASEWGMTPGDAAKYFDTNAGQVNKFVKNVVCEYLVG